MHPATVLFALILATRLSTPRALPYAPRWRLATWAVCVPAALVLSRSVVAGSLGALTIAAVLVSVLFSWPVARAVLIPLGRVRAAYWLTIVGDVWWRLDRPGGGAVAAAWALARRPRAEVAHIAWVSGRIEKAPQLRGAGVLAGAMLSAARGELADARALFESVEWIADGALPARAKAIAGRWLRADLAARGEWRALAKHESDDLLTLAARRIAGVDDAPNDGALWRAYLRGGAWWATWGFLQRALAARETRGERTDLAAPSRLPTVQGTALQQALALHAALVTLPVGALTGADFGVVVRAWDQALADDGLQTRVTKRALELRASVAERALPDLRATVSADLAGLALGARVGLGELGGEGEIARKVAWQLRDVLLVEVEAMLESLRQRVDAKRDAPKLEEWREFVALRRAYDRAARAGGLELRRLAFASLHRTVCAWAVWIFNERKERAIGNAMFRWMLDEAELVGDTRTEELQRKNVACGV